MPTPDYHFLYIDPALGADWLFVAARRYWERFRPMVVTSFDLVSYVPPQRSIAITTLARRDLAKKVASDVKKNFPHAFHDPLVYDYIEEMKLTLDGRADLQQRFGVPEIASPPKPVRKTG
jgi:hypothetical protein